MADRPQPGSFASAQGVARRLSGFPVDPTIAAKQPTTGREAMLSAPSKPVLLHAQLNPRQQGRDNRPPAALEQRQQPCDVWKLSSKTQAANSACPGRASGRVACAVERKPHKPQPANLAAPTCRNTRADRHGARGGHQTSRVLQHVLLRQKTVPERRRDGSCARGYDDALAVWVLIRFGRAARCGAGSQHRRCARPVSRATTEPQRPCEGSKIVAYTEGELGSDNAAVQGFRAEATKFAELYGRTNDLRILAAVPKAHDQSADPKIAELCEFGQLQTRNDSMRFMLKLEVVKREIVKLVGGECDLIGAFKNVWRQLGK
ncbi:hypothetical protein KL919_003312 [Ogataea angusta]|nr:hypothetical protein KL919_003312 [Ogataea angusta]